MRGTPPEDGLMKNVIRGLLVAGFVLAWTLAVPGNGEARRYVKDVKSGSAPTPDNFDGSRGDDDVVVPEPGTLALLGLGLASLGYAKRRKDAAARK
jgi:hypothetical protein